MPAFVFFFNDTATTEIYTLSLHDALPISVSESGGWGPHNRSRSPHPIFRSKSRTIATCCGSLECDAQHSASSSVVKARSEEHTSELQSQSNLVCRLLLEKKTKVTQTRLHQ